jgi:hypothetical protein
MARVKFEQEVAELRGRGRVFGVPRRRPKA